jgi:hypothetical protein
MMCQCGPLAAAGPGAPLLSVLLTMVHPWVETNRGVLNALPQQACHVVVGPDQGLFECRIEPLDVALRLYMVAAQSAGC